MGVVVVTRLRAKRGNLLLKQTARVPFLLPGSAVGINDLHRLVGGAEFGLNAIPIRPRKLKQIATLVVLVFGTALILIDHRRRAPAIVVLKDGYAAQRIDFADWQPRFIKFDD